MAPAPPKGETFDYIVVGAGSAGCVVAARLSENPSTRVCLIEAGPRDSHPFIHIPAMVGAAIATRAINWRFLTAPQPRLANRRIPVPRGRVIGGSGSINGMVYHRGQPADYGDWVAAGNPGWSYQEVLPYFLRSERNLFYAGSPYHSSSGPMNVKFVDRPNSMTAAFLAAMAALGFSPCEDFAGPNPEGYGLRQGTIRDGRRVSTATAYLEPARARANLAVLTDALVERVVFDARRAVGVDVRQGGELKRLAARAEIVISGGSINSPQILMLSGVGDGAHLRQLGIEVVHDLPSVGTNLHDHLAAAVLMEMRDTASYGISARTLPRGAWNLLEYAVGRKGPLASNVFESTAFLRTTAGLSRPDIQLVFQTARRNRSTFPLPLGHGFAFSAVSLYPKSRGRIRLASPDPAAHPDIDPNLLGDPADVAPLVRGIQLGRKIAQSAAFAHYRAREVQPGPEARDEAAIVDYIRRASGTVHHPVGTCYMSGTDARSVVDAQLRVRGVEALRVVDASVFPSIVGGNTNAPTVMVAERGADMLLGRPRLPAFPE